MTHTQRRGAVTRLALGAAIALAALVGTTACSTPVDPGPQAIEGGTLTIATSEINSLDPQGTSAGSTGTGTIAKAVFSTLVTVADGEFSPDLATEWESNDDGTQWTFTLNPDAVFSDGTPVTAGDVKASLERLIALKGPYASLFGGVTAEAVDDGTLAITTKRGGTLLYALTLLYVGPADRIADDAFWADPVGSGPFVVDEYSPGESVTIVRNDDYWGTPATLDSVVFANIPEVSGQVTALETGDVDIVINLPQDQIPTVEGMDDVSVVSSEATTISTFWFNNSRAPLDDVRVRQALWEAVDWDSIREDLYGETANDASAPIASGVFGWAEQPQYEYDVEGAKKLLKEAGLADGFELELKYNPAGGFSQAQSLVEAAVSYWAKVGVTVKITPQEQAIYLEDLLALNWDITPLANTSRTGDADQILGRLYVSSANRLGFSDPEVDRLLGVAAASADPDERLDAYSQIDAILWKNAVAIWPMELTATYAVNNRVLDFVADPSSVPSFASVKVSGE